MKSRKDRLNGNSSARKPLKQRIALKEGDVINLEQENIAYEKAKDPQKHSGPLADKPLSRGKESPLSGKHSRTGLRLNGVRRRAGKPNYAQKISEESEEYTSTTRFIESSLGIKPYSELAPYLAKGVERVMALLLNKNTIELSITPEFICTLHKDAFGELFPAWAGQYRDRNVTVGKHIPPAYYEVPLLMRQYCEDVECRLSSLGVNPPVTEVLLEALSFAEGKFLSIHPFLDFNGRVARMLLFALLYRLDLPPVEVVPDNAHKATYLAALSEADKQHWQPLIEMWRQRMGLS